MHRECILLPRPDARQRRLPPPWLGEGFHLSTGHQLDVHRLPHRPGLLERGRQVVQFRHQSFMRPRPVARAKFDWLPTA